MIEFGSTGKVQPIAAITHRRFVEGAGRLTAACPHCRRVNFTRFNGEAIKVCIHFDSVQDGRICFKRH